MEVPIIRIGNSKGIVLSRLVLDHYGFGDKLELEMRKDRVELRPVAAPREGWSEKFRKMNQKGEDRLIMDLPEEEIPEEWK